MTQAFEIMGQNNGILTHINGTDFDNSNGILTQPKGMVFGYARVSTKEQNSARQKEALQD